VRTSAGLIREEGAIVCPNPPTARRVSIHDLRKARVRGALASAIASKATLTLFEKEKRRRDRSSVARRDERGNVARIRRPASSARASLRSPIGRPLAPVGCMR